MSALHLAVTVLLVYGMVTERIELVLGGSLAVGVAFIVLVANNALIACWRREDGG